MTRLVAGWEGRYLEDFQAGDVYRCRYGRTVTEADNIWFTVPHEGTLETPSEDRRSKPTGSGTFPVDASSRFARPVGSGLTTPPRPFRVSPALEATETTRIEAPPRRSSLHAPREVPDTFYPIQDCGSEPLNLSAFQGARANYTPSANKRSLLSSTPEQLRTLLTNNTNQIHFNNEYGKRTPWGRCLVNSALTLAIVAGMGVADVSENGFALGWDEIRLPNPLFAGDTLYSESEVVDVRESRSRPEQGVVKVRTRGYNQSGEVVIEYTRSVMVWKRDHAPRLDVFPVPEPSAEQP